MANKIQYIIDSGRDLACVCTSTLKPYEPEFFPEMVFGKCKVCMQPRGEAFTRQAWCCCNCFKFDWTGLGVGGKCEHECYRFDPWADNGRFNEEKNKFYLYTFHPQQQACPPVSGDSPNGDAYGSLVYDEDEPNRYWLNCASLQHVPPLYVNDDVGGYSVAELWLYRDSTISLAEGMHHRVAKLLLFHQQQSDRFGVDLGYVRLVYKCSDFSCDGGGSFELDEFLNTTTQCGLISPPRSVVLEAIDCHQRQFGSTANMIGNPSRILIEVTSGNLFTYCTREGPYADLYLDCGLRPQLSGYNDVATKWYLTGPLSYRLYGSIWSSHAYRGPISIVYDSICGEEPQFTVQTLIGGYSWWVSPRFAAESGAEIYIAPYDSTIKISW